MIKFKLILKDLIDSNKFTSMLFRKLYSSTYGKYITKKRNEKLLLSFDLIIKELMPSLKKSGIEAWPAFGTLLGIYRDGSPIKHDLDIDLGIWLGTSIEDLDNVFNDLGGHKVKSFHSRNNPSIQEITYSLHSVLIDFFVFDRDGKDIFCHDFLKIPGDTSYSARRIKLPLTSFKSFEYKDVEVIIPSNIEEHLSSRYGLDFMIPNPKFNTNSNNENIKYVCNSCYMKIY